MNLLSGKKGFLLHGLRYPDPGAEAPGLEEGLSYAG
jgi:hypothetical protein